jgi:hypothetical protein
MALDAVSTQYNATKTPCLAMQNATLICQAQKAKSPQLRGLQGIFCYIVPGSAGRKIIPTQS